MKTVRIFLVVPLVIAGFGLREVFVFISDRQPIEVPIERLKSDPPKGKWLRVTGGKARFLESVILPHESTDGRKEILVPVCPESWVENEPISVLLRSTDPKLLEIVDQLNQAGNSPTPVTTALQESFDGILYLEKKPIEGLVAFGFDFDDREMFAVRKAKPNIVKRPIVIQDGKRPTLVRGFCLIVVAIVVSVWIWRMPEKSSRSGPPPLPVD